MPTLPEQWLRLASKDSKTAKVLFDECIGNHVCFHAQQQDYFHYLDQFYTSTRYPFFIAMLPNGSPGCKEAEKVLALWILPEKS